MRRGWSWKKSVIESAFCDCLRSGGEGCSAATDGVHHLDPVALGQASGGVFAARHDLLVHLHGDAAAGEPRDSISPAIVGDGMRSGARVCASPLSWICMALSLRLSLLSWAAEPVGRARIAGVLL